MSTVMLLLLAATCICGLVGAVYCVTRLVQVFASDHKDDLRRSKIITRTCLVLTIVLSAAGVLLGRKNG